ncbi:MAG: hypothetical protein Q4Q25_03195 [Methanocorpusculum sp.]|nr:hypothetical protein [Methanocorpusculum sp.]
MNIAISTGESRKSTTWKPEEISWTEFCQRFNEPEVTQETVDEWQQMTRDERANVKDVGGFVGGVVAGGRRSRNSITERQLVSLDVDYFTGTAEELMQDWDMYVGYTALIHTTHSHRPDHPRYRMLIPLSRPVTAD